MHYTTVQFLLLLFFLGFLSLTFLLGVYIIKQWGSPIPRLCHEFDKKIWMTLGLGIIFFGFYFIFITFLGWSLKGQSLRKVFIFLYNHTASCIYIGLSIFSFFSLSIYLARILIKHLYKKAAKKTLEKEKERASNKIK
ncbi:hypothetical protein DB41_DN00150 [Neochlamydia sp. TUME1]|nr:hypothetical protein DB41_DN00150 [Neochlamydia sp. TUME1]